MLASVRAAGLRRFLVMSAIADGRDFAGAGTVVVAKSIDVDTVVGRGRIDLELNRLTEVHAHVAGETLDRLRAGALAGDVPVGIARQEVLGDHQGWLEPGLRVGPILGPPREVSWRCMRGQDGRNGVRRSAASGSWLRSLQTRERVSGRSKPRRGHTYVTRPLTGGGNCTKIRLQLSREQRAFQRCRCYKTGRSEKRLILI